MLKNDRERGERMRIKAFLQKPTKKGAFESHVTQDQEEQRKQD
jgi:hypothetical protein